MGPGVSNHQAEPQASCQKTGFWIGGRSTGQGLKDLAQQFGAKVFGNRSGTISQQEGTKN